MARRLDPEDATFHSMRDNMVAHSARRERTAAAMEASQRAAYSSGTTEHVQLNPGEKVRGWRFDQKDGNLDLREKAKDIAQQNDSTVHVQGWRFDQKDGNSDLREKAKDIAQQNDSTVHVQSSYSIRTRGGKKVGAPREKQAPMTADNMNPYHSERRAREMEVLVAERARRIK